MPSYGCPLRMRTADEWIAGRRLALPSTPDDVTILSDGRHIDCREAALIWLAELAAQRAAADASA